MDYFKTYILLNNSGKFFERNELINDWLFFEESRDIIANGIPMKVVFKKLSRNKERMLYSVSYDNGPESTKLCSIDVSTYIVEKDKKHITATNYWRFEDPIDELLVFRVYIIIRKNWVPS